MGPKPFTHGGFLKVKGLSMSCANGEVGKEKLKALYEMVGLGKSLYMERQQTYEVILQNLPLGFSMVDKDGIIVEFNPAAESITGYRKDEVIGKSHLEILQGAVDSVECPLFKNALSQHEQTIAIETTIKGKNGSHINLSVTAFPLLDERRYFSGAVALFRNISDTKRLERERKNIMSMFAHDMQNPITTSGGYLSRLLSGKTGELSETQQHYLKIIREELYKASDLLADFLEFSRIEAKAYIPVLRQFNIDKSLRRNIDAVKPEADKKGLTISFEVKGDIPSSILADPAMMDRVIANLLDNAIAYTDSGGTISVALIDRDDELHVSIMDTGKGIAEDKLPYIFDAFYRLRGDSKGTGLGLFIVKSFIEAHGGKIEAISKPGKGSTFSFTVPKSG